MHHGNVFWFQSTSIPDNDFILKPHMESIDKLFSGSTVEEIFSNLESDDSEWAQKQLSILKKMVSFQKHTCLKPSQLAQECICS